MVACPLNGFDWVGAAGERFPAAEAVTVAIHSQDDADVLDTRGYGVRFWQVRGWLKRQHRRSYYQPTLRCGRVSRWLLGILTAGLRKDWWIIHPTGQSHRSRKAAVTMYAEVGSKYSVSLVADLRWPQRFRARDGVVAPVLSPPVPRGRF